MMKNIKEDSSFTPHRMISIEKLLKTHSRSIQELLDHISKSYKISRGDAAFALSNAMQRLANRV
jgi:hypothetical protein